MEITLETLQVVVEVCFHLVAIVGGVVALLKWWKGQSTARARFLKVLIGECNKDAIQDFCEDVESEVDVWSYFDGSDLQKMRKMKKALRFFSYVCRALDAGLINSVEFEFFKPQIKAILSNECICSVLAKPVKRGVCESPQELLKIISKHM